MEITASDSLIFERIDNTSTLSNFYCGLQSMDTFIHDQQKGINAYVELGLTKLWTVKCQDEIIAIFALSKGTLILSSFDRTNLERKGLSIIDDIFDYKDTYPAIEIDYLAVSEKWRHKNIGSFILNEIERKAAEDQFSATMFITVEAIETSKYSAVGFYKKLDFVDSEHGLLRNQNRMLHGETSTTRRMYRPIYNLDN